MRRHVTIVQNRNAYEILIKENKGTGKDRRKCNILLGCVTQTNNMHLS
jgi:hypothetical protein